MPRNNGFAYYVYYTGDIIKQIKLEQIRNISNENIEKIINDIYNEIENDHNEHSTIYDKKVFIVPMRD